ncbi:MAG TPA: hypothetical protein PKC96_01610 [Bacilli bacterium]|nr:hypothetical protein [Bacilli bacterium]
MINNSSLKDLFGTISKDLLIDPFTGESEDNFHKRLVYSAIAKWIIQLFADRDFEEDCTIRVSKSHVTISAKNVLEAYIKIEPQLKDYFSNEDEFVGKVESIYLNLGYIKSGFYSFKYPTTKQTVVIGEKTLIINLDTSVKRMIGLGIWRKPKETDLSLNEFLMIQYDSITYFEGMLKNLKFDYFNENSKIEIYNIEKNRWDFFNDKQAYKYPYSILKIDNGLDYQILKIVDHKPYVSSLPAIYSKTEKDDNFIREIWRIILGLCGYCENSALCTIEKYCDDAIKISLGGYVLPFNEFALFKTMCWPLNDCNEINEFVTYEYMRKPIKALLNHLSIGIMED